MRSRSTRARPHAGGRCLSCRAPEASGTALPGSPRSPLASCPQDTAEYVAYVAKDPVNQRGEAAAPFCGSAQCGVRKRWGAQDRLKGWRT